MPTLEEATCDYPVGISDHNCTLNLRNRISTLIDKLAGSVRPAIVRKRSSLLKKIRDWQNILAYPSCYRKLREGKTTYKTPKHGPAFGSSSRRVLTK